MTKRIRVLLRKSTRSNKKFMVQIHYPGGRIRTVHFGGRGYSDYTIHKDKARMRRYENRHRSRENWTRGGLDTAGFWAKWILWSRPSLPGAISHTASKFGLRIDYQK